MSDDGFLNSLKDAVIAGKARLVKQMCEDGLKQGVKAGELLSQGMLRGMVIVGEKFSNGEFFVPEMLVAARAMNSGLKVLEPYMKSGEVQRTGKVVIGTVAGDLHDIGKNLAGIMMTAEGFDVIDLGIDVPAERFVEEVKKNHANAVGLSALLTTTMTSMESIIKALRQAGFTGKVVIGGAPITQEYADKIGADVFASDASEGARKLKLAVAA